MSIGAGFHAAAGRPLQLLGRGVVHHHHAVSASTERNETRSTALESHHPTAVWPPSSQVGRCLISYAENGNCGSYGPTIELIGVRKRDRGTGLGRVMLDGIIRELTDGCMPWFPEDARFGVQICHAVDSHAFYERLGFKFDEGDEEGRKVVTRVRDRHTTALQEP